MREKEIKARGKRERVQIRTRRGLLQKNRGQKDDGKYRWVGKKTKLRE